jgi:FkbM family methyltransferase
MLAAIAAGRALQRPAELRFEARSGPRMLCPNQPGARVPIYEVFAEDCYRTAAFLADAPVSRALDIGAHVGAFAVQLAALKPGVRIDCFEPSERTASYLRRNVELNGLGARIVVHQFAVAGHSGVLPFSDNGMSSCQNHVITEPTDAEAAVTMVTARAFDDLVSERGPYELIKIDCEGGEYDLVLSSAAESWASTTHVVAEYHPSAEHSFADLETHLARAGLRVVDREDSPIDRQGTAWFRRA